MKEQILLDTTYVPEYAEYVAYCGLNDINPQYEYSQGYWDYVNESQRLAWEDFRDNVEYSKSLPSYWVISGSLGLWNGRKEIEQVLCDSLAKAVELCYSGCMDIIVKKRGHVIYVTALHHDGRNRFEIIGLSDVGVERLERNGRISLRNRENIVTLPKYLF